MLLKLIDNKKNIEKILNGKYPTLYIFYVKLIQMKKNILSLIKGKFKYYKNIEGIKEYNIEKDSFKSINKKNGFSAFSRLHNSQDFLKETIESNIKYFDEIILVNNNSTDNTEKICLELKNKYPKKIKYFTYKPYINKIGTKEYFTTKENSIHSFSYYSNWVLSKVNYKYVMKLDDDHICIPDVISKLISEIKTKGLKSFYITPLINIYKKNDQLSISKSFLKSSIAGLFGDLGFFAISEKTYFIKQKGGESMIFPYKINIAPITFLHLKWLKKGFGLSTYGESVHEELLKRIKHKNYDLLNKKFIKILKNNGIS